MRVGRADRLPLSNPSNRYRRFVFYFFSPRYFNNKTVRTDSERGRGWDAVGRRRLERRPGDTRHRAVGRDAAPAPSSNNLRTSTVFRVRV